jgi:hypothetical protein
MAGDLQGPGPWDKERRLHGGHRGGCLPGPRRPEGCRRTPERLPLDDPGARSLTAWDQAGTRVCPHRQEAGPCSRMPPPPSRPAPPARGARARHPPQPRPPPARLPGPGGGADRAGHLRGRGRAALPPPARGALPLDRLAEAVGAAAALGGPAVPVGSLVRVIAQEHGPGAGRGHGAGPPGRSGGAGGHAAGRGQGPLGS